ncbi:DUF4352 domain-containing protein, partial [Weissella confusa]
MGKDKVKKPFYKKVWFWALVVIVIAIGGIGGSGSDDSSKDSKSSSSSSEVSQVESAKSSESSSSEKATYGIGQDVAVGKLTYKVNSVTTDTNVGGQFGVNAKGVFMIVNISITNNDTKAASISDGSLKIKSNGAEYKADSSAGIYANDAGNSAAFSDLNPGTTQTTNIVFDVPQTVVDDPNAKFEAASLFGLKSELI